MLRRILVNQQGFALIITLFVVALVTVLVLEYHFDARIELELAAAYGDDVKAYYLALSAVNLVRAVLAQDKADVDGPQDSWAQVALLGGTCITPQELLSMAASAAATGGAGTGSPIVGPGFVPGSLDSLDPSLSRNAGIGGAEDPTTTDSQDGCVSLAITDESSKLPLNALMPSGTGDAAQPNPEWKKIFEAFFESFDISPDIVPAIVDWIDADDDPSDSEGAEKSYYEGLEKPYPAANKALRTPGELRLIRGFTPENLAKLFRVPVEEVMDVDMATNDYLTVYGAIPAPANPPGQQGNNSGGQRNNRNQRTPGNSGNQQGGAQNAAKVNINTARPEVLHAIFAGLAGGGGKGEVDTIVNDIVTKREEHQCAQVNECVSSPPQNLANIVDVKSSYFQVIVEGRVGSGSNPTTKRVIAVIERISTATPKIVYFKVE